MLFQQEPIILLPAFSQMIVQTFWETNMLENQAGSLPFGFEIEPRNRIHAFRPRHDPPGLNKQACS